MTADQLRAAIGRALRSHYISVGPGLIDEPASIADHHAAEEVAASKEDGAA